MPIADKPDAHGEDDRDELRSIAIVLSCGRPYKNGTSAPWFAAFNRLQQLLDKEPSNADR